MDLKDLTDLLELMKLEWEAEEKRDGRAIKKLTKKKAEGNGNNEETN